MTKRQDLCLQRRSRSEQADQRQTNQAATISHQPRASPDSTALTSRIQFPTMTTDEQLNRMAGVSRPAKTFTPKQGQYLAFIHLYTRLHRRPPAETDMQQYFRVSPPSVHQMVLTLVREGFIRWQPKAPRSIEVLVDPNL